MKSLKSLRVRQFPALVEARSNLARRLRSVSVMLATLWVIPITAFAAATVHLLTRWSTLAPRDLGKRAAQAESSTSDSAGACDAVEPSDPVVDPLTRESLEHLCRGARVQELSVLLTTPGPRSSTPESLHILVDFERTAIVDYPAFLRLQHELSTLVGRKVVLFARGRLTPNVPPGPRAVARVLYAV